jgi:cation transport ATPase
VGRYHDTNDVPATAAASVITMDGGTDLDLQIAEAAILSNRIQDTVTLVKLSRRRWPISGRTFPLA